ncbi:MAG: class I SAM-dependent methyltransferase [Dehalococcoidia bacterium]
MTAHAVAPVLVTASSPALAEAARERARALGLEFAEAAVPGTLALRLDEEGWALLDPAPGAPGAVRADLVGGGLGERLRAGGRNEGRLASALGLKRRPDARVLDATAGLGRESAVAAALGCTVVACERSPIVATLLRDALDRAAAEPGLAEVIARIDLRVADARDVLRALAAGPDAARPDVVIVDPMFPERSKAARAKKEMQLLQRLLGPDDPADTLELIEIALATARRRVVLKRPVHAPQVAGVRPPDLEVPGRAARYDVYVIAPPRG